MRLFGMTMRAESPKDRQAAVKPTTILFFVSLDRHCFDSQLEGFFQHPRAREWRVQVVADATSREKIHAAMDFWKPSGVLVEHGDSLAVPPSLFGTVPAVFIDIGRRKLPMSADAVGLDSAEVGRMGAGHLLGLGLSECSYIGFPRPILWDREREAAFVETVRRAGGNPSAFSSRRVLSPDERYRRLFAWIKALPRPCGVMACNDRVGEEVLNICARLGIGVPDEMAVLGVDNDATLCENATPPLASIDPGTSRSGLFAAQMLDRLMFCPARKGEPHLARLYPPLRVVVRESARRLACDRSKVSVALEMIRRRACEGVRVADVVAEMGVSRRAAEKHFRLATGKSILQEIDDVRFERVFEMLRDSKRQIGSIAGACGFSTEVALRKAFRLRTGMSMSAWRKRKTSH